jgi:hypothetical protein
MALAIEPMVNLGTHKIVMASDGWTARTADGKVSAHFEHTVLVTENGPEIPDPRQPQPFRFPIPPEPSSSDLFHLPKQHGHHASNLLA